MRDERLEVRREVRQLVQQGLHVWKECELVNGRRNPWTERLVLVQNSRRVRRQPW